MKSKSWEVSCDCCDKTEYYYYAMTDTQLRKEGWIVLRDNIHYCCKSCYNKPINEDD